jgi:predicted ABC-type exoprotein transport system permease subunit
VFAGVKHWFIISSQSDFSSAWQDYKKRQWWFYVIWLGGTAVLFILAYPLIMLLDSTALFYILLVGQVLAFIPASLRLTRFKCPRCHEWLFTTFIHNPFARRCVHCKLPKWQLNP